MPGAVRGAMWMLLAALAFSGMGACVRYLATDLHPLVTSFFRAAIGMVLLLPFLVRAGRGGLRTERHGLFAVRGAMSACFVHGPPGAGAVHTSVVPWFVT